MDVPTIPEGYVAGHHPMDICDSDSDHHAIDPEHGGDLMIEILVFATVFTLIVLLTGGPTNGV